ncbi:MAG: 5'/3'-nucleotidase SurE [Candidatus Atribacteria bacterium]|nr:5'/3'-nucleotidase SurE [Candidatus Atribacteria bacterium]
MKILLTNDDGIDSEGLKKLKLCLEDFGQVVMVAPDRERSGSGCSTSFNKTIRCQRKWDGDNFYGYSLSGTPVDCVIIGLEKILNNDKPDLIISGINTGTNLGYDIFYSGTVGAAIEGVSHHILSIAFSIDGKDNPNYISAEKVIRQVIQGLTSEIMTQPIVLNINIPNIEYSHLKGFKLTKPGHCIHQKSIKSIYKDNHAEYFWLEGSNKDFVVERDTDLLAIKENFISITPLSLEFNNRIDQYGFGVGKWVESLNSTWVS